MEWVVLLCYNQVHSYKSSSQRACLAHFFFLSFVFLGLHPWHMVLPRLGIQSELNLLAYATATATLNLSHICDLHCSLWKSLILNPLTKARDLTHILTDSASGSWLSEPQQELLSSSLLLLLFFFPLLFLSLCDNSFLLSVSLWLIFHFRLRLVFSSEIIDVFRILVDNLKQSLQKFKCFTGE